MWEPTIVGKRNASSFEEMMVRGGSLNVSSDEELQKLYQLFSGFENSTSQQDSTSNSNFETERDSIGSISAAFSDKSNEEPEKMELSVSPLAVRTFRRPRSTDFIYDARSAYAVHPTPVIASSVPFNQFPEKPPSIYVPMKHIPVAPSVQFVSSPMATPPTPKTLRREMLMPFTSSFGMESPSSSFSSPSLTSTMGSLANVFVSPVSLPPAVSSPAPIPLSARRQPLKRSSSQANLEGGPTTTATFPEISEITSTSEAPEAKRMKREKEKEEIPTTATSSVLSSPSPAVSPHLSSPSSRVFSPSSSVLDEDTLQGALVRKIVKALKVLHSGTGTEITSWVVDNSSDPTLNKKKLVYTVNAVLSSKKYAQFFIKESIMIDGNRRALWKLGEAGMLLEETDEEEEKKDHPVKEKKEKEETDSEASLTEEEEKQKLRSITFRGKSSSDLSSEEEPETDKSEDDEPFKKRDKHTKQSKK